MEFVENWLYNVPQAHPQTRKKPMKVLALGMSRSRTESLRRGLQMLGYDNVYHGFEIFEPDPPTWRDWVMMGRRKYGMHGAAKGGDSGLRREDFDAILGNCEAVTDQPCALFAAEMIRAYPEALVILNQRDVDSWYESACKVFPSLTMGLVYHILPWFNAGLYWESRYVSDCFQQYFYHSLPRHGKWVYEEHCAKVRGLVPPDRLLEWAVEDGWEPLCKFLGKEIPPQQFPSGNTSSKTLERYNDSMVKCQLAAKRNFLICLVLMGVLVAYMVQRISYK